MTATAHIIAMARTPIGRRAGSLAEFQAHELGGIAIAGAVERAGLDIKTVEFDDIIMGCTLAATGNTARVAALQAGLRVENAALTIDRQCGSGINAVALAADAIRLGAHTTLAGGAESMTNEPYLLARSPKPYSPVPPQFLRRGLSTEQIGDPGMGITAENLAERYHIAREAQDEFALRSQERYQLGREAFAADIVPVTTRGGEITADEHPRPESSLAGLAKLRPAFAANGTVTAGNASGINDAAGALVLVSDAQLARLGAQSLATVGQWAVAGVDPNIMGIGPVPAIRRLLAKTQRTLDDYLVIEINEAFAVQVLACVAELGIDAERVNAWGGAIAHGHPIAATGAILVQKVVRQLQGRGGGRGLVAACIGGGQGIALEVEVATQ
ncbi:thiolase family protein [Gulosibacter hominis]|uniref:thiolase family protein n=1 Tax=Gulosibacter hominis TaxID=2770504 RepID=UPI00191960D4|nr:thiolase family protein [Gulosibacter hominis]